MALNVVHVDDCSFLGVAPTVIYLADRKEVTTIDGLGVWPKAASVEYFQKNHGGKIPTGVLSSLTPAAADSWLTSLSRFGTMTFGQVATAAIDLAGNGFPMFRYLAGRFKSAFDQYNAHPSTAEIYLPGGRAPKQGEMFYQKDLAATLSKIADVEASNAGTGREAALKAARDYIYVGELGRRIASYNQEMGGLLTEEDLARYHVQVAPPVTVNYKGYDVYSTGPWGQGPAFPQALKILEGYDLASMGHNSAEYIHTVSQALNLAFADREQYVGDPDFVDVPINEMLAEEYLVKRRSLIDSGRGLAGHAPRGRPEKRESDYRRRPAVPQGGGGPGWHSRSQRRRDFLLRRNRPGWKHLLLNPQRGHQERRANNSGHRPGVLIARLPVQADRRPSGIGRRGQAAQAHSRACSGVARRRARNGPWRPRRRPYPAGHSATAVERLGVWPRPSRGRGGTPLLQL